MVVDGCLLDAASLAMASGGVHVFITVKMVCRILMLLKHVPLAYRILISHHLPLKSVCESDVPSSQAMKLIFQRQWKPCL